MPHLSTRQKAAPLVVQLTLDFDTPTQAERDATFTERWLDTSDTMLEWTLITDPSMLGTPMLRTNYQPCRCPSCGAMPVSLSFDNALDVRPFRYGTIYRRSEPRVELTCRCSQRWFLPQGWEVGVRDRAAPPGPNEVLLIEDYDSMVYARPSEQPYYQPYYTGNYANAVNVELSYEYLQRARQRMQDEMQERAVMQYRMALP